MRVDGRTMRVDGRTMWWLVWRAVNVRTRSASHCFALFSILCFLGRQKRLFAVLPFCEHNVYELLKMGAFEDQSGQAAWGRIKKCAGDVLAGAAYLARRALLHRDIKPSNILVTCVCPLGFRCSCLACLLSFL